MRNGFFASLRQRDDAVVGPWPPVCVCERVRVPPITRTHASVDYERARAKGSAHNITNTATQKKKQTGSH